MCDLGMKVYMYSGDDCGSAVAVFGVALLARKGIHFLYAPLFWR